MAPRTLAMGILGAFLCGPLATPGLAAQAPESVRGTVTERGSDRPVAGAVVEVAVEGDTLRAISSVNGAFSLPPLPPGLHDVLVRHFGFTTVRVPIRVPRAIPLEIGMSPEPIGLDEITVTASRMAAAEEAQRSRRNSSPRAVQFIGPERMAEHRGTADQLLQSAGIDLTACRTRGLDCPRVCIDERVARGGLDELNSYPPEVLHSVEIYPGLPTVRAYTRPFMEAVAVGREMLLTLRGC